MLKNLLYSVGFSNSDTIMMFAVSIQGLSLEEVAAGKVFELPRDAVTHKRTVSISNCVTNIASQFMYNTKSSLWSIDNTFSIFSKLNCFVLFFIYALYRVNVSYHEWVFSLAARNNINFTLFMLLS